MPKRAAKVERDGHMIEVTLKSDQLFARVQNKGGSVLVKVEVLGARGRPNWTTVWCCMGEKCLVGLYMTRELVAIVS
jgi:hypothetical protein